MPEGNNTQDAMDRFETALRDHDGKIKFNGSGALFLKNRGFSLADAEAAARKLEKGGRVAVSVRTVQFMRSGRILHWQELDVRLVPEPSARLTARFEEIVRQAANVGGWHPNRTVNMLNRLIRKNPALKDDLDTMLAEALERAATAELLEHQ